MVIRRSIWTPRSSPGGARLMPAEQARRSVTSHQRQLMLFRHLPCLAKQLEHRCSCPGRGHDQRGPHPGPTHARVQIGASIGTAPLNNIATGAAASFITAHATGAPVAGARRTGGGPQLHRRVLGRCGDLDSRGTRRSALATAIRDRNRDRRRTSLRRVGRSIMKAAQFSQFEGPEVLDIVDLPDPHPGPGQVRIVVHAAGISATDPQLRAGTLTFGAPVPQTTCRGGGRRDRRGRDRCGRRRSRIRHLRRRRWRSRAGTADLSRAIPPSLGSSMPPDPDRNRDGHARD
jgi:hypothetical protein